jgi:SAM-dependent methyltransferase
MLRGVTYEIEVAEVAPTWIAAVRRRVAWSELGRVIPELLGQVQAWLGTLGERAQAGRGVAVYHQPTAEDVELECGVQIAAPVPGAPAPIRCGRAPAGRALRVSYRGPSSELGRAHGALAAACQQRGYPAGVRWEVYGDRDAGSPELAAEVHGSIEPNAAQLEYWNGPAGDRWAATWQVIDRAEAAITRAVLERAAPGPGERVLDVGCGAGSTTLVLRERVGAGGAVTGIDISAPMLAVARARAAATDVTFLEADASTYAFRPEHELVFSRFGVMFFAEPERAFANLRRAAAEGGRLAFVCWRAADDNAWVTVSMRVARELQLDVEPPPPPHVPGPFAFVDRDRLHGFLERAGWREIAIERHDHAMIFGDTAEQAARAALRIGPLARSVANLGDDARGRLRDGLIEALTPLGGPDGVALPASSWLVSARP